MAQEDSRTDLFGNPIVPRKGGPGRPEVVWNQETSNKALLAFARGLTVNATAHLVDLSEPTFRKVYFREVELRKLARLKLEITMLAQLAAEAGKGNVTAIKELDRLLDKQRSRDQAAAMASKPPAKAKVGKKVEAEQKAQQQRGMYEPPAPPSASQVN